MYWFCVTDKKQKFVVCESCRKFMRKVVVLPSAQKTLVRLLLEAALHKVFSVPVAFCYWYHYEIRARNSGNMLAIVMKIDRFVNLRNNALLKCTVLCLQFLDFRSTVWYSAVKSRSMERGRIRHNNSRQLRQSCCRSWGETRRHSARTKASSGTDCDRLSPHALAYHKSVVHCRVLMQLQVVTIQSPQYEHFDKNVNFVWNFSKN